MDTTSGEEKKDVLLQATVECPRFKNRCLSITIETCQACKFHRMIELVTEVEGVGIFDVLCTFPFRRRVTQLITEMKDAGAE